MTWPRLQGAHGRVDFGTWGQWEGVLAVAQAHGWQPRGACVAGIGPHYTGEYLPGRLQVGIGADDAAGLALALRAALPFVTAAADDEGVGAGHRTPVPVPAGVGRSRYEEALAALSNRRDSLVALIQLCEAGPLSIEQGKNNVYFDHGCDCAYFSSWREEVFHGNDHALVAPWAPRPDFSAWTVFAAVRGHLQAECESRLFSSRLGLAGAICGHLDTHPGDALLPDSHLLLAVRDQYFAGPRPFFYGEADGWNLLSNVRERAARTPLPPATLPPVSAAGPWWRAARILHCRESALHAATMEWLWRGRDALRVPDRVVDNGHDSLARLIQAPDLELVQTEVFGSDRSRWPLQQPDGLHTKTEPCDYEFPPEAFEHESPPDPAEDGFPPEAFAASAELHR